MDVRDFSSLDPHQEQQFAVFERALIDRSSGAMKIAIISAVSFTVLTLLMVFTMKSGEAEKKPASDTETATETAK